MRVPLTLFLRTHLRQFNNNLGKFMKTGSSALHRHIRTDTSTALKSIIKVLSTPGKSFLQSFHLHSFLIHTYTTHIYAHTVGWTTVSCLSSHWTHLENNPSFSGKCLCRGLLVMAVESASCGFVLVPYTHTHIHAHTFSLGCV